MYYYCPVHLQNHATHLRSSEHMESWLSKVYYTICLLKSLWNVRLTLTVTDRVPNEPSARWFDPLIIRDRLPLCEFSNTLCSLIWLLCDSGMSHFYNQLHDLLQVRVRPHFMMRGALHAGISCVTQSLEFCRLPVLVKLRQVDTFHE